MSNFHAYLDTIEQDVLEADMKSSRTIGRFLVGEKAIYERRSFDGWGYFPREAVQGQPFAAESYQRFS